MILWKEEYKVGIKEIDEQHRKLFEIVGQVYDLLKTSEEIDKFDQIVEIIQELKDYTVFHFQEEEEYMLSINYPKFLSHRMIHKEFVQKINDVNINELDGDQTSYLLNMLDFLLNWLQTHILQVDKDYNKNI